MAIYTVNDPKTGKTLKLEGNSPPTEQELEEVFSQYEQAPPASESKASFGEFAGNLGQNALDWVDPRKVLPSVGKQITDSLMDIPLDVAKSSVQGVRDAAKLVTGERNLPETGKALMKSPIVERTRAMTEPIAKDPVGFAYKRPLDAASLLLAPIAPFLGRKAAVSSRTVQAGEAAPGLIRRATAKTISVGLGAPEDAILERMKNPTGVKTAFTHAELADQMVNSVNNLNKTISELAGEAHKNLRSSPFIQDGAIPKTKIAEAVKSARRDLGGIFSNESKQAASALKSVADNYKKLRSTVSESQVKDLIQQIDADIDWSNPAASRTNEALVGVRTRLDGMLKKQNRYYAEAMKPVNEAMNVMNDVQKKFGVKRKTGEGFVFDDSTVGKLRGSLKENKVATQSTLEKLKKVTGEDWESKLRQANIAQAFEGSSINGARRAVAGTAAGMFAGPVGGAVGAITGIFADIYGKRVAGFLADALSVPEMQRYIPRLQAAATKGPRALATLHASLIERDPDYTAMMAGALNDRISGSSRDTMRQ